MSALNILAEAVIRIEHKLDHLLRKQSGNTLPASPLHFVGQMCPVCNQLIDYTVDVQHQIVVRRCGCKTGKVPSTIPLIPIGEPNGKPPVTDAAEPGPGAEDSDRSKGR